MSVMSIIYDDPAVTRQVKYAAGDPTLGGHRDIDLRF